MRLIVPSLREPLDTTFLKYVRLSPGGRGLARCLALTAVPAPRCSAHVESLWTGTPAKQSHSVAYPSQRFADAIGQPREESLGSLRGRMLGTPSPVPLTPSPDRSTHGGPPARLLQNSILGDSPWRNKLPTYSGATVKSLRETVWMNTASRCDLL
jgi:hypothetical protein